MHNPGTQPLTSTSLVSFSDLFTRGISDVAISEIEIPLIQRDYAQGRNTESVRRIRDNFISTLCLALQPGQPEVDLDFIFGDVDASGKFYPLDGQQRLTTLFLLHCYLAWQIGVKGKEQPWARFSYATRPGARAFCAFLAAERPDFSAGLSDWIRDHAAYLPTWEHDPTIQSMLTVLDTLHRKMFDTSPAEFQVAYSRLTDPQNPAIRFHVLPMRDNGLTDKLYIKMNSRGKPLTPFENFKAHFEALLKAGHYAQADSFTKKVDTVWSDILWEYRGSDNLIDDEFMRYFRCVTEINAWNAGITFRTSTRDDDLAELVYGDSAPQAAESVTFLFQSFDVWEKKNIQHEFESMLTRPGIANAGRVPIFNAFDAEGVDLFAACCRYHGDREWTLAHTLLLYGILVERAHGKSDSAFPKRLRILRNLVEASSDEIRTGERNNMPKLLAEVRALIIDGDLDKLATFNRAQIKNERAKAAMLTALPALEAHLHALEDHDLLRGGLTAFDLDHQHFAARTQVFLKLFNKSADDEQQPWKTLAGALLSQGDYSRQNMRASGHRTADFGSPRNEEPWRELFRGKIQEVAHPMCAPLAAVLDAVSKGDTLDGLIVRYLNDGSTPKDWRYYFVKYDVMRNGASGRYTISPGGGYQACMLDKERLTSNYYDPYLLAIVRHSRTPAHRIGNDGWPRCYTGFETSARALILKNSGVRIRCVEQGWEISGLDDPVRASTSGSLGPSLGLAANGSSQLLPIIQSNGADTVDRIEKGAALLQILLEADL
jgi:hypothetical protein